jgi:hypothetical protein
MLLRLFLITTSVMIHPGRSDILQVVLETLSQIYPHKEYFALSDDIYSFIDVHWNLLCTKPRTYPAHPPQSVVSYVFGRMVANGRVFSLQEARRGAKRAR